MLAEEQVNIGVLGAGPIAQFAHFEACQKAFNVNLYSICDVAEDLLERVGSAYAVSNLYQDYSSMLADPNLDAVIIATADEFHISASLMALEAGKHVLCEKPLGTSVDQILSLKKAQQKSQKIVQVGHMKRFDPGIQSARNFIQTEMGEIQAVKAWYCDSTHRYINTDAVQPKPIMSSGSKKPKIDPRADLERYYLLAHGSHLVDTARFLGGPIATVRARLSTKFGAYCWFIDVDFENGCLGHLDLTVAVRMDWHEGFQVYGEHGAIVGKTYNPWFYRSSEVDIFRERTGTSTRILGADGHFYRRQVEGFAKAILERNETEGADINDGEASVRAMIAIRESVYNNSVVALSEVSGVV